VPPWLAQSTSFHRIAKLKSSPSKLLQRHRSSASRASTPLGVEMPRMRCRTNLDSSSNQSPTTVTVDVVVPKNRMTTGKSPLVCLGRKRVSFICNQSVCKSKRNTSREKSTVTTLHIARYGIGGNWPEWGSRWFFAKNIKASGKQIVSDNRMHDNSHRSISICKMDDRRYDVWR
jgi:hypothetical protein